MRLLVTRPADEAGSTASVLRGRGHDVVLAPLLRIETVADADFGPGPWAGVLLTSANAVRALAPHRRKELTALPLFAVGSRTAEAARAAGFSTIISAEGSAADLARVTAERLGAGGAPLLYLAGSDRAHDLASDLGERNIRVETIVVYRALAANKLPALARRALQTRSLDGILHYSRRSSAIFLDCAMADGLTEQVRALTHYCLSARVAEPLRAAGASDIRIASHSDDNALVELITRG
ncbi:MAG: uroporphyrinogen-III synthase [Pseudomonadota bacterium]|nr:uroporphyrinogen-III synthase [Pseudomonadota bacterium]